MSRKTKPRPPAPAAPEPVVFVPPKPRTVLIEDVVNLVAIGLLFAITMLPVGNLKMPLLVAIMAVVTVLFVRRKMRVDRLFAEMRRRQRELDQAGGVPLPFGVSVPPRERMTGQPTAGSGEQATTSRVKRNGRVPHA